MYVYHVCAWCPWKPKEGIGSPELKLQMFVRHTVGAGSLTSFPAEPSLQLPPILFQNGLEMVCDTADDLYFSMPVENTD